MNENYFIMCISLKLHLKLLLKKIKKELYRKKCVCRYNLRKICVNVKVYNNVNKKGIQKKEHV